MGKVALFKRGQFRAEQRLVSQQLRDVGLSADVNANRSVKMPHQLAPGGFDDQTLIGEILPAIEQAAVRLSGLDVEIVSRLIEAAPG